MSDVGIFLVNSCFDLKLNDAGNDLARDEGLETAVTISLFTDQRAESGELPFPYTDKRGWWADPLSEVDKDQIGSKLWLVERGKRTNVDLTRIVAYAKEALDWMVEDGVASDIEVSGAFESNQTVLRIQISKPGNLEERYSVLWDEQEVRRA